MESEIKNATIGEMIEVLLEATRSKKLERGFAQPLYNALRKYYKDTSEDWETVLYDADDFEERMERFKAKNEKKFANPKTVFTYKSRAKRAVEVYIDLQRKNSTKKEVLVTGDYYNENISAYYKKQLRELLEDKIKSTKVEVFLIPTRGDGNAAIVIPRNSTEEVLEDIKDMLNVLASKEKGYGKNFVRKAS